VQREGQDKGGAILGKGNSIRKDGGTRQSGYTIIHRKMNKYIHLETCAR